MLYAIGQITTAHHWHKIKTYVTCQNTHVVKIALPAAFDVQTPAAR